MAEAGPSRVNIMREEEGSLRRLQTDYIDLYQVHGWDSNTPLEETLRTLDDLVLQGKVRYRIVQTSCHGKRLSLGYAPGAPGIGASQASFNRPLAVVFRSKRRTHHE